ncbi:EAL domain-containing protein [Nocardioides sp.]|uniref:EAL domain-containing protein n=1 Tax=Nocardioides sp. TaxID=35761 RepID=UPI00286AE954|nr:EAL domain-containing protein [Nocardioides sp.]
MNSTTTSALTTSITDLRTQAATSGRRLVLIAASLSNGPDLADVYGVRSLDDATAEIVRRAQAYDSVPCHLLRVSRLGSFLAGAMVEPDHAVTQVAALVDEMREMLDVHGERVWPIITVAARECGPTDDVWGTVRDVRGTLVTAQRDTPGGTSWHHDDDEDVVPHDGLTLVRDLAEALTEQPGQVDLAYQPVVDLRHGAMTGAEALLRWHHPLRGPVGPLVAIEAAERTGLIHPLGRVVLERAVRQLASWRGRVGPTFRIHVNVSPIELREASYADGVAATLRQCGVRPQQLLLEITETALLADDPRVLRTITALHQIGVGLGIDDFGTGYSSIRHLHRLPIDTVKVDRSLVAGIATSPSDFALTRAVLGLLTTTGATVVAEGIEDPAQQARLLAMGCTLGQGYHLGRPVAADALFSTAGWSRGGATGMLGA